MKRYIAALIITVLLVPLFSIPVFAESLNMKTVVEDSYLPSGYITPNMYSTASGLKSEIWFYDEYKGMYFNITFDGFCSIDKIYTKFILTFSNPDSLQIRAYPCNGREVFSFTEAHEMNISFPGGQLMEIIPNAPAEIHGYEYYDLKGWNDGQVIVYGWSGDSIYGPDRVNGGEYGKTITLPTSSVNLSAMNIPITIDEFASKSIDYYIVQKTGSGITTPIDYEYTWSIKNGCLYIGIERMYGMIVAAREPVNWVNDWNKVTIKYSVGSYYYMSFVDGHFYLQNSEKLGTYAQLPLSILNRYLSHFGYDSVFYSPNNAQLNNDLNNVGNSIGSWSSAAGNYSSQASSAISSIQGSISSFQPLFIGVWNVLPGWFYSLMAVVFVIVVGRKILGR